jgi:hypothetical protein
LTLDEGCQRVCPYGQPGDILWVRETHAFIWPGTDPVPEEECNIEYKADTGSLYPGEWPAEEARGNPEAPKWQPSIHMPKWAARLFLEITDIRVERVQDISEEDAEKEGAEEMFVNPLNLGDKRKSFIFGFTCLWDSINAKRGYSWDNNPWCWMIEFRRTNV